MVITWQIRFLASEDTWGTGGKFKSTSIILHSSTSYVFSVLVNAGVGEQIKSNRHISTFWMYPFGSQPQMEGRHRGTRNKVCPESSYLQHDHELCFLPFLVPNNLKFHTWCVSCPLTVQTIRSLQFSAYPAQITCVTIHPWNTFPSLRLYQLVRRFIPADL